MSSGDTCVRALQSMLALPINTCFLSTIQNLLWRTPLVKRPKFTFLTWTPSGRGGIRSRKVAMRIKTHCSEYGGRERGSHLSVSGSLNLWSLFSRWECWSPVGQIRSWKAALQVLSGCPGPVEDKALKAPFSQTQQHYSRFLLFPLITHRYVWGRVDVDVVPS